MQVLAFADMHGSMRALKEIKSKAKNADIVLCCGDLTIFEQNLRSFLRELDKLKKPVLMIPGNHENSRVLKKACDAFENIVFLDARAFETDSLIVLGAEGNGFGLIDRQFDKLAKSFEKILRLRKGKKKYILMTHAPPYNTKLDSILDGHCGNKSIRNFIMKSRPSYAFSGHIHENAEKRDTLGKTRVINPGPKGILVSISA